MPYVEKNYTINKILSDENEKGLIRIALKALAEEVKIHLSLAENKDCDILTTLPIGTDDEGKEIEIDMTLTKEKYEEVVKPIFQRAIDISKNYFKIMDLQVRI